MQDIIINAPSQKSVIHCGGGSFKEYVPQIVSGKAVFLITDSNVNAIYANLIEETFAGAEKYVIPAGERSKTYTTLLAILGKMADCNVTRSWLVVAFGGGVVGDVAGLAASLYMRGVHLLQIPTTLLAQVDSSVGGKTAIDFKNVKNMIGTFYQPEEVVIDSMFLKTLTKRELRCGLGEIIKYGALNKEIYNAVVKNGRKLFTQEFFEEVTPLCVQHKAVVVEADEKDTAGIRKSLNLGHTTGHAFELYYKKRTHGEFVLVGMYYELYIAARCGIVAAQYKTDLEKYIKRVVDLPAFDDVEKAALSAAYDKKNGGVEEVTLIVPKAVGEFAEIKLPMDKYVSLISECGETLKSGKGKRLKLAVIGKDVSNSVSPQIHSFIAEKMGNDISYEALSVPEDRFEEKIGEILEQYDGFNVTIPYKLSVIPHLKKIEGDAQSFGSVNTVSSLSKTGYNTDGLGFMLMLKNNGVTTVRGKRILLLGAGGAGRSIAKKLSEGGAKVFVYDKNAQVAEDVAERFKGVYAVDDIPEMPYELIVNATGVGMHDTEGVSPVGEELLSLCGTAVDLIYHPEKSEFLRIAERFGKPIVNGLAMLFYQAYYSECIYFGAAPNASQAKKLYEEYLQAKH